VNLSQYSTPLIAVAICFVPAAIALLTYPGNLGGFSTVLFRDYVALLVGTLLAWTAPYLLPAAANAGFRSAGHSRVPNPAVWWTTYAYFLALTALTLRTLYGAPLLRISRARWLAGGLVRSEAFGHMELWAT
jgi:hypothetical protein